MNFSFKVQKDDRVAISCNGKPARVLKGTAAINFLEAIRDEDDASRQLWMARVTGNFKRGNEGLSRAGSPRRQTTHLTAW